MLYSNGVVFIIFIAFLSILGQSSLCGWQLVIIYVFQYLSLTKKMLQSFCCFFVVFAILIIANAMTTHKGLNRGRIQFCYCDFVHRERRRI